MKDALKEVKSLYRAERYEDAFVLLEVIEKQGFLHPEVLAWKGRCLQLMDESIKDPLSEVKKLYDRAMEIDNEYIPVIIELGYFHLRVLDQADVAVKLFERASSLQKGLLTQTVVGMAECLAELKSKQVALDYLTEASKNILDIEEIHKVRDEINSIVT